MKNTSFLPAVAHPPSASLWRVKAKAGLLFSLLLLCTPALCQQSKLRGQIAVQNSRFDKNGKGEIEYVPFAEVDECSQPRKGHALSDAQGQWAMEVVGIADKNPVFLKVTKADWQVVNADALQAAAGQTAPVRLFMATSKYITDAKRRYYNTGYTEAEKNLNLKIAAKQKEMDALRLQSGYSEQQLRKLQDDYGLLQNQYEKLDGLARELSEKYARINLDDAGQLYQDAFRLFQAGDLDGAMRLWQNANLSKQVKDNLEEGRRLGALKKEVSERDSLYTRNKADLMQNLRLKADAHRLRLEWDSVELVYEALVSLDTTNLQNLNDFCDFLWKQNKVDKGIFYANRAHLVALSEADLAKTSMNLGTFYYTNQKMGDAEKMYLRSLEIYERLAKSSPAQFEPDLAKMAMNLGAFYYTNQKMGDAEKMYLRSLGIFERLAKSNPAQFEPDWAMTANNLGLFYYTNQKMGDAERMYLRSLEIFERLAKSNPAQFDPNLATMAHNLGLFYATVQKIGDAEKMYLRSLEIYERLAKSNPAQFEPHLAFTLNNFGFFKQVTGLWEEAKRLYSWGLVLRQKEVASGQTYFGGDLNSVYNNMASLRDSFELKKDHASASAIQHERAACMYALKNISIEYKLEAATAYNDLYLLCYDARDYKQAAEAAEKVLELAPARNWVRLNLGHSYLLTNDWPKAKTVYEEYLKKESDPAEAKKTLSKDWDDLEAAGITCPGMAKARAWLKG